MIPNIQSILHNAQKRQRSSQVASTNIGTASSSPLISNVHLPVNGHVSNPGQHQNFHQTEPFLLEERPNSLPDVVDVLPYAPAIGQDDTFKELWGFLKDDHVGMVGIYGMGGVGKTTLLKRINNELEGTSDFDIVMWVVVSKEVNVDRIQKTVLRRLKSTYYEDKTENQVAIFKALRNKKFVLLIDDLWLRLDLEEIGVPSLSQQTGSKIIFTTRSEKVCAQMKARKKIKINCLAWKNAWDLFKGNVGEVDLETPSEIANLAERVAEECQGLPLALVVIARAMTSKRTPQEWKHALATLRYSPSEITGTVEDLYHRLKFSYDMLPNDEVRQCFLYCSLFPEDYLIQEKNLLHYWVGEGFLSGCKSLEEAVNKGYDVIGALKVSCLLEESVGENDQSGVKMHDVIRDMALWVASDCGANKSRFLVEAGAKIIHVPKLEKWRDAGRISLMENIIPALYGTPDCPNLLTLLLQSNHMCKLPNNFFLFMPLLRVLDLSYTRLEMLPGSIGQLVELRYLNLSGTALECVPQEIGNLQKLGCLVMSNMSNMVIFHPGLISRLSQLQVFDIHSRVFNLASDSDEVIVSELERLGLLSDLSIRIRGSNNLVCLISSPKLAECVTTLSINLCRKVTCLKLLPSFGTKLKCFSIDSCVVLEDIKISVDTDMDCEYQILPATEELELKHCYRLKRVNISNLVVGRCLQNLQRMMIYGCRMLEDITWVKYLQSLVYLYIYHNDMLEELFGEPANVAVPFPKLEKLVMGKLGKMKRICGDAITFPSLESLEVFECSNLRKLPLGLVNEMGTLKTIEGDEIWWNGLEWSGDDQSLFQPLFRVRKSVRRRRINKN